MTGFLPFTSVDLRAMAGRITPQAEHLRPLVEAVGQGACCKLIRPGIVFGVPRPVFSRPAIALIGDDPMPPEQPAGPGGFHLPGLRKLLRAAVGVATMAGAPVPEIYRAAALMALATRRVVVLIETQERREADWAEFTRKLAPRAARLIVTPRPAGRA